MRKSALLIVVTAVIVAMSVEAQCQVMVHDWSQRFGGTLVDIPSCVAIDGARNIVTAGKFQGAVDFGGGVLTSVGDYNFYLAKYDASGGHIWSQRFGDGSASPPSDIATNSFGDIIFAGSFSGTVDLGGGPLTSAGATDIYVAKFDADGNHVWSQRFGGASSVSAVSVAVDAVGSIILAGYFGGSIDCGGGELTSAGGWDVYVAKFDPSGNHLWSSRFGDGSGDEAQGVAVDYAGNVIVTGRFIGTIDFGGGVLTSAYALGYDIYVAKLNADGSHIWSQGFGNIDTHIYSRDVAVDMLGNAVITGRVSGYGDAAIDFGGGELTGDGSRDIYVAKFDGDGSHVWSQRFGSSSDAEPRDIDSDGLGNVIVTCKFADTIDFGGGPLTSAGSGDIAVAVFDWNGSHSWSQRYGDAFGDGTPSVAIDGVGDVVLAGFIWQSIDFGGDVLTSAGEHDIYLAKLARYNPVNWSAGEGGNAHWYEVVSADRGYMWDEARILAESRSWNGVGGQLATLTSQEENSWVWNALGQPFQAYLGGHQSPDSSNPSANWTWVTGEPWSYTNWWPGEPNDGGTGNEPHLHFTHDGHWNDVDGNLGTTQSWIVEYEPPPYFSSTVPGGLESILPNYQIRPVDLTGDGVSDVYASGGAGSNVMVPSTGPGTYGLPVSTVDDDRTHIAWVDLDNDGDLDLCDLRDGPNAIYRNDGGGVFSDVTTPVGAGLDVDTSGLAAADFDGDGNIDLYLNNEGANQLLRNDGTFTFEDVTSGDLAEPGWGTGCSAADFDLDGDVDIYVANHGGPNKFLRNDGGWVFSAITPADFQVSDWSTGIAIEDFNNDGWLDVYQANAGPPNGPDRMYLGGPNFAFSLAWTLPSAQTYPVAAGDFDNDGWVDVLVGNVPHLGAPADPRLYRNIGAGQFVDVTLDGFGQADPAEYYSDPIWWDVDSNGSLDLSSGLTKAESWIWSNGTPDLGHWINITLEGVISNRMGAGARVRVVTDSGSQAKHVMAGTNYGSNPPRGLWFGLGSDPTVDSIEITWPSGITQLLTETAGDQSRHILEPVAFEGVDIPPIGSARAVAWVWPGRAESPFIYLSRRSEANVRLDVLPELVVSENTHPLLAHPGNGFSTLWFDFAADRVLDPYIVNGGEPNVLLFNNAIADDFIDISTEIVADSTGSRAAEALDFDNDGDLDLFVTRTGGLADLLLEYGPTGFMEVTPPVMLNLASTVGSTSGDYDNDGDLDLYLVRWNAPNTVVRNDGGGVWTDASPAGLAESSDGTSAAWGDYDNDGLLDLALTNASGPIKIYRNDGAFGFTDLTPPAIEADSSNGNVAWIDYDNDGWLDLFYTRGPGADRLWRNTRFGFDEVYTPVLSQTGNHAGAAWADADEDGDLDVFQAEYEVDAPSRLLLNRLANGNSWLEIDLIGEHSNRFGVGARVRVISGGISQIRDVVCSAGNKSQNMIRAHFGLGSAAVIDSLIIQWPSGIRDVGTDLPVNQIFTATEGASVTDAPKVIGSSWLGSAVPNPFNPKTTISYALGSDRDVQLIIYDLAGRRVKTLVSGHVDAGQHEADWDGRDESGKRVASGVYLYRLTAGEFVQTKRMVLLK